MTKKNHLKVAQVCFDLIKSSGPSKKFWETYMYESLFRWAGWKE